MSSSETEFHRLKPVGCAIRVLAKRGKCGRLRKKKDKRMIRLASQQEEIVVADEHKDPIEYTQSNTTGVEPGGVDFLLLRSVEIELLYDRFRTTSFFDCDTLLRLFKFGASGRRV